LSIRHTSVRLVLAGLLAGTGSAALAEGSYRATETGVVVTPDRGPEHRVRLQVYGDGLIRVTAVPGDEIDLPPSLMVNAKPQTGGFSVTGGPGTVTLATKSASAVVSLADGNVTFRNAAGQVVLAESGPAGFTPVKAEGQPFLAVRQQFNRGTDEGFYGLGQHQNRQMNYNGEDVELAQHNMDVAIPFVLSTRNYGVLWDNNSITRFGDPDPYPFAGGEGDGLHVTGAGGQPGWTATYAAGGKVITNRQEPTIDLQYLENRNDWPAGTRIAGGGNNVPGLTVTWTGTITPETGGLHRFQAYSSGFIKVFVDGHEVLNRWRQNWNPWYHNFDVELSGGKPHTMRIEWAPDGGYMALLHNDPRPEADRHSLSLASEYGHALDYYFIAGHDMDSVISGYRQLTGKAPIMPRWAYGFWQSRQPITPKGNFSTQKDLLGVVHEYRTRKLPLDNIVQDWFYWPENQWGCHCFDPARYSDPQAMIDEMHANDTHFMISVWAKFYPNTENFNQLDKLGGIHRRMVDPAPGEPTDPDYVKAMYRDWVGPGYPLAFYDPYNKPAADLFAKQVHDALGVKGVDAWWLDSDEPDFQSNISIEERERRMSPTAAGPGTAFFNSYPLVHVENFYQHQVASKPDVRPFILTRSGFGGIQRAGAALWSGDVPTRWQNLRDQISAGVNFSMSGDPNWTHDIGGFSHEDRYVDAKGKDLDEWREINTRWFQFGAFSPLFRSHGEYPFREIYNISPKGTPAYSSMEYYDKLRYRLMPYIYALGADTYFKDGTIMRGLVMDFAADKKTWTLDDEYMFGPAFLVAPVTEFHARSRQVYLPHGTLWYDFYTGRSVKGGQTVTAAAPYERIPLFVRAGSIVPTGPAIQSTAEMSSAAPLALTVYTGADGTFTLYEDDGVSRQYLNGVYARIPVSYDDKTGKLTLGARVGSFPGMAAKRTINVRWVKPTAPRALDLDAKPDATVEYDGSPKTVSLKR
jgi:alpha-D-xyloside xylohydrolase